MKAINYKSIKVGNVLKWDYPDFVDAQIEHAEFEDGTALSDEELDELQEQVDMNELAHETLR